MGGELCKLTTPFKDPSQYFGAHWKQGSEASGNVTGVCGRVGIWDNGLGSVIHWPSYPPHQEGPRSVLYGV
jgi:hypothetical protein